MPWAKIINFVLIYPLYNFPKDGSFFLYHLASDDSTSVTRLGDLLQFGQLFKACGNNYIAQFANTFYAIFVNLSKSLILLAKSFFGNFNRHLVTFYWSHWTQPNQPLFILSQLLYSITNELSPASFLFIVSLFQANITIFTTNLCEKCPSLEYESTTSRLRVSSHNHYTRSPGLLYTPSLLYQ